MKLKSCPFCGNSPNVRMVLKTKMANGKIAVLIPAKEANGPHDFNTFSIECKTCKFSYPLAMSSKGIAVDMWNTRIIASSNETEIA